MKSGCKTIANFDPDYFKFYHEVVFLWSGKPKLEVIMESGSELLGSTYRRGKTVFLQGAPSDAMYIIESGSVEVSRSLDGVAFIDAIYGKGDFFGEMSLLQNDVRSTTAIAICDTLLTKLNRDNFIERLKQDPFMSFNLLKKLIQRIHRVHDMYRTRWQNSPEFRANRTAYTRNALACPKDAATQACQGIIEEVWRFSKILFNRCAADNMTYYRYRFETGEAVFRKGEAGNTMFLVLSGAVGISDGDLSDENLLDTIGPGDFFGEMALIANIPRSATVTALEATELIAIDKQRFMASIHSNPELAIAVIHTLVARLTYINKVTADPTCR